MIAFFDDRVSFESLKEICESVPNQNQLTNGDKLRAMSDEELAEFIATAVDRLFPVPSTDIFFWLDWLKQEVDDGR